MKALQMVAPREVVLVDDAPMPAPKDGEVLVQAKYTALCGSNMRPYEGTGYWSQGYPRPLGSDGHEVIGTIAESRLEGWEPGTLVLAHPQDYLGFAEFLRAKPPGLVRLPAEGDVAARVVAQPLATVLRALRRTEPVVGKRCAVVGQGPMGLIFTHLLGRMGAKQVIGIDLLAWRLAWAKRLGATDVVDASKHDTAEAVKELTGGEMADLCVEAAGDVESLATAAHLPRRFGTLMVFGVPRHETQDFPVNTIFRHELVVVNSVGADCVDYFQNAVDMVVEGRVDLGAIVTPRLPFDQAPRAFEMYASHEEGTLKLVLEL